MATKYTLFLQANGNAQQQLQKRAKRPEAIIGKRDSNTPISVKRDRIWHLGYIKLAKFGSHQTGNK